MRKQPEILSHQLTTNKVAAMLDQAVSPFISQINVPTGAASSLPENNNPEVKEFANIINNFSTSSTHHHREQNSEFKFGAPQIDLSLPAGTLTTNGIHQFNPKHFRDQEKAFQCALLLASRQRASGSGAPISDAPVFCFLTEDQTDLIKWLSGPALIQNGLNTDDIVIITAKHSDDLLWAMEETLHTAKATALIAHFSLLDNLSAQRLAYASRQMNTPCLLICNHKIEGPVHTSSQWAIEQIQTEKIENEKMTDEEAAKQIFVSLTLSDTATEYTSSSAMSWALKWQADKGRFSALLNHTDHAGPTLH